MTTALSSEPLERSMPAAAIDPEQAEAALVLDGVTKRFGKQVAVDAISARIPRGSIYGFLGPNGAGKTTTIRMIMSIIYPDAGRISILGEDNAEAIKDRLGYLPEEKGLYKKMTTVEILTYFGRLKGMGAREARTRARELLERYGLGDAVEKKCEALSKGMGQKVQILGTVMHDPEMVILDEPFSGLDPVNVEVMRDLILDMKRQGRTVIFSTHIMPQAEQLCDALLIVHRGKKVLDGTLSDIKSAGDRGILLDYDGDGAVLKQVPGVARVNDSGKQAEIFLDDGVDPQSVLEAVVGRLRVRRFDLREPSLHEVFVRAVGGEVDE
ncbi:MAG TPA: ATP-binding cassette domain-containing protein [Thermoanaerobaculia bacterium]|nr:ATP-binding cassette domain-containing protein [Thermoanaerobaculia bacterium]